MYRQKKLLSQNFLHNRELVKKLIRGSSLGKNDLVLEIGPGKGIITEELVNNVQCLIAVEIDYSWYNYLRNKFRSVTNLTLYHEDFLNFHLPFFPYKVFANIPFSIEGKTIRKLIDAKYPPEDCYLVMREEVAYRLSGRYGENLFSLSHKPWFNFSIFYYFQRTDFIPTTRVKVVMLRFIKRKDSLIPWHEKLQYQKFVEIGFGQGLPIALNLRKIFGRSLTTRVFNRLHINRQTKPSELSLSQWIDLYEEFHNLKVL